MHFPDTYHVGIQPHLSSGMGGNFPLGWPVPDGTDHAAKKRKESVAKWTNEQRFVGYKDPATGKIGSWVTGAEAVYEQNDGVFKEFDNVPTEGFRFVGDVTRSRDWFGSGASMWRVEDPRGFEFEITSGNLMMLMELTSIDNGAIKGKCLYARDGSKNALLLENSEEYQATLEQTNRLKDAKAFTLKSIKVGDEVITSDGLTAVYYGKVNCLVENKYVHTDYNTGRGYGYHNRSVRNTVFSHYVNERYLLLVTKSAEGEEIKEPWIELPASPKISAATGKVGRISLEDAMGIVVSKRYYMYGTVSTSGHVIYISKEKIKDISLSRSQYSGNELFKKVDGKNATEKPCKMLVINNAFGGGTPFLSNDDKTYAVSSFGLYSVLGYNNEMRELQAVAYDDDSSDRNHLEHRGFHEVEVAGTELKFKEDVTTSIMRNEYNNGNWMTGAGKGLVKNSTDYFNEIETLLTSSRVEIFGLNVDGKFVPAYSAR